MCGCRGIEGWETSVVFMLCLRTSSISTSKTLCMCVFYCVGVCVVFNYLFMSSHPLYSRHAHHIQQQTTILRMLLSDKNCSSSSCAILYFLINLIFPELCLYRMLFWGLGTS